MRPALTGLKLEPPSILICSPPALQVLDYIENRLVAPFWQDPVCGDGACDEPFEFPAFGRFGCRRGAPLELVTNLMSAWAPAGACWGCQAHRVGAVAVCWLLHLMAQPAQSLPPVSRLDGLPTAPTHACLAPFPSFPFPLRRADCGAAPNTTRLLVRLSSNFAGHPLLAPRVLMAAASWNLCLQDSARRRRGDADLCWCAARCALLGAGGFGGIAEPEGNEGGQGHAHGPRLPVHTAGLRALACKPGSAAASQTPPALPCKLQSKHAPPQPAALRAHY